MRKVIFHYHLFKNAGTSLDSAFKEIFTDGEWVTREFPGNAVLNREQVKKWIIDTPDAKCFSSHTALLPPPEIEGVDIFPVIFIRHPIDRIVSAYTFERKQGGDGFGSVLARNTSLSGYVECRMALPHDRQCRDFHSFRLASMFDGGVEAERAFKGLKTLPFVGLVEKFQPSLENLNAQLIDRGFIDTPLSMAKKNVSRAAGGDLAAKLELIRGELGGEAYSRLVEANSIDLEIFDYLVRSF